MFLKQETRSRTTLTDEEWDFFSLIRARATSSRFGQPLITHILFRLIPVSAPGLKTMAIDKWFRVYIDFEYMMDKGVDFATQVLNHEPWHNMKNHSERAETIANLDFDAWNLASDAEINDDIRGLIPKASIFPSSIDSIEDQVAEFYYAKIMDARKKGAEADKAQAKKDLKDKKKEEEEKKKEQEKEDAPDEGDGDPDGDKDEDAPDGEGEPSDEGEPSNDGEGDEGEGEPDDGESDGEGGESGDGTGEPSDSKSDKKSSGKGSGQGEPSDSESSEENSESGEPSDSKSGKAGKGEPSDSQEASETGDIDGETSEAGDVEGEPSDSVLGEENDASSNAEKNGKGQNEEYAKATTDVEFESSDAEGSYKIPKNEVCSTDAKKMKEYLLDEEEAESVSEFEQNLIMSEVARQINDEMSRTPGNVSNNLKLWAEDFAKPTPTPWQKILGPAVRNAIQWNKKNKTDYHKATPNRRQPIKGIRLPALRAPTPRLLVGVDTSGSHVHLLPRVGDELHTIIKSSGVRGQNLKMVSIDTHLKNKPTVINSIKDVKFSGGGGTSMLPFFDLTKKMRKDVDIAILLTDGEVPSWYKEKPAQGMKYIVCILGNEGDKIFDKSYLRAVKEMEWAKVVKIEVPKEY